MKVIILAAGKGERLCHLTKNKPKSMIELSEGKAIIDVIVDSLKSFSFNDITIVTRPNFSKFFYEKFKGKIKIIETLYEDFGNLHSLEIAFEKNIETKELLVVMSDHIFEEKILNKILKYKKKPITLCLDRKPSREAILEGLKIKIKEGKVVDVGKEIKEFDGIDTGLFIFSKEVFPLIKKIISEKGIKAEISDLLKEAKDLIEYVDVTGYLWQDIDTEKDLEKAKKLYWKILKKNLIKENDGLVSKYVNRQISTSISLFLFKNKINIEPNLVTIISFFFGLISAYFILQRMYLIGGILVFFSSVIDGIDGEIARLRNKVTNLGGFIDSILDRYVDLIIILAIALSIPNLTFLDLFFALLASAGIFTHSYIIHVSKVRKFNLLKVDKIFPLATRDIRLFIVTVFCIISLPLFSLYILAIIPIIYTVLSLVLTIGKKL